MSSMSKILREGTLQIFFRFHRIAGFNVELNLEDRERVVERADKSGRLAYSGPLMRWETQKNLYLFIYSYLKPFHISTFSYLFYPHILTLLPFQDGWAVGEQEKRIYG